MMVKPMNKTNFKKVRMLHIIDSLKLGGTEIQCYEIVKRISKKDYYSHVVTFNKAGPLAERFNKLGINVTEFKITGSFYNPASIFKIVLLSLFIRKNNFKIIQTYGFYSTIPGVIAAKVANAPYIIAGKRDMNKMLSKNKIKIEKFLWKYCHKIVVNACKIKEYLVTKEGIFADKIEVIYNGVDIRKYPKESSNVSSDNYDLIGMIANFRKQKDHRTFLLAAKLVLNIKEKVKFILIGSGPLELEMKKFAEELGIKESVLFYGQKTGKELYEIFRKLSINVLSSTNEGLPNTILEAMAMGIPVIANPSGGIPELIKDGEDGYLFPYKNADILLEKILTILENEEIAYKIGSNAKMKVESNFTFDIMQKKYDLLYRRYPSK